MIRVQIRGNHARVTQKPPILTTGTVGLPVVFSFDESWEGLKKTAVFRCGGVTRDVTDVEEETSVPFEVMAEEGFLEIGVCGTAEDGSVVIPTIWAQADRVFPGAVMSGVLSADPPSPSWAALREDMERLKKEYGGLPLVISAELEEAAKMVEYDRDLEGEPFSLSLFTLDICFPVVKDAMSGGVFYINDNLPANFVCYYYDDSTVSCTVHIHGDLTGGAAWALRRGQSYTMGAVLQELYKPLQKINIRTFAEGFWVPAGTKICLRGV